MLRSAATAGIGITEASANANDAVLAHSNVFITRLNGTNSSLAVEIRARPLRVYSLEGRETRISGRCGIGATDSPTPDDFSANLPNTYEPMLARFRWPARARWYRRP